MFVLVKFFGFSGAFTLLKNCILNFLSGDKLIQILFKTVDFSKLQEFFTV
jgi:hypothetical protein